MHELEELYTRRYLSVLDKSIPLHCLADTIAKFTVVRTRFKVLHPRGKLVGENGEVYLGREEGEVMFEAALTALELVDTCLRGKFASHLFVHMTLTYQLDAYVYVLSELRRRCVGDRVALAWRLVEDLYTEHPELIDEPESKFFVAFGDLVLEAWEARRRELVGERAAMEDNVTPNFIRLLWEKRQKVDEACIQIPISDSYSLTAFATMDDNYSNWEYWNDFLQI